MTVCDLLAYLVLIVFITFMGWHHWLIIRRQHLQILNLEALVALKTSGPEVQQHLSVEQQLRSQRVVNANPPTPEPEYVS